MGVPRRTPQELEPSWIEAYERQRNGESLREIAAAMAGPPHFCGNHTTARRWAENGLALAAAKGDPLRKTRARREMAVDALNAVRVEMTVDAEAGHLPRDVMYRLKILAIEKAARIGGYEAPRPTARIKVAGN